MLDKNSRHAIKIYTGIPEIQQVDTYFYRRMYREDIKDFSIRMLKVIMSRQKTYHKLFGEYATYEICPIIAFDEIEGALLIFAI